MTDPRGEAEQRFVEWFLENYPPDCVLSRPAWHAPKIWRAAKYALLATPPSHARAVAELIERIRFICVKSGVKATVMGEICHTVRHHDALAASLPDAPLGSAWTTTSLFAA